MQERASETTEVREKPQIQPQPQETQPAPTAPRPTFTREYPVFGYE